MIALVVFLGVTALPSSSIDGGGTAGVTAGPYRLGATIGQADAGLLAGGGFTLRGGFWSGGPARPVGASADSPLAFRFFPTWPNPVRSTSRIAFDLPHTSRVALSVFDVSGRMVRRWDLGSLPAGHQERMWDARDDRGVGLSSGVYFLRLDADRYRGGHKAIVLR